MPYQYIHCLNSFRACNVNYTINLTTLFNSDLSFRVGLFLCINKASEKHPPIPGTAQDHRA